MFLLLECQDRTQKNEHQIFYHGCFPNPELLKLSTLSTLSPFPLTYYRHKIWNVSFEFIKKTPTIKVGKILNGYLMTPSAFQTAYYETSQICVYYEWGRLWNEGK